MMSDGFMTSPLNGLSLQREWFFFHGTRSAGSLSGEGCVVSGALLEGPSRCVRHGSCFLV